MNQLRCATIAAALLSLIPTTHSNAQSIAGLVINQSTWSNPPALAYPGNGSSTGTLLIAAWTNTPDIYGAARFAATGLRPGNISRHNGHFVPSHPRAVQYSRP